jgi:hypothetical protein
MILSFAIMTSLLGLKIAHHKAGLSQPVFFLGLKTEPPSGFDITGPASDMKEC